MHFLEGIMKNPKSILALVFLFTGFLFQAYANPTEKEKVMRLKVNVAFITRTASGNGVRRGVIVNIASKAELLLADGARTY